MSQEIINKIKKNMEKIIILFENKLDKIRTNYFNKNILYNIIINYNGVLTPLQKLSNIVTQKYNQLIIKPFDCSIINLIIIAINKADLGLVANSESNLIKLNIFPLTEERRKILVKKIKKEKEQFKITIRNERLNGNKYIKKNINLNKENKKYYEEEIQKLTNQFIKKIDDKTKIKEKEIMKI